MTVWYARLNELCARLECELLNQFQTFPEPTFVSEFRTLSNAVLNPVSERLETANLNG